MNSPPLILEGQILDGRNRWKACEELGIEAKTVEFDNGNPLAFIISHNLHRRHLNESQRAMIAARLVDFDQSDAIKKGIEKRKQRLTNPDEISSESSFNTPEAAALLNVNKSTVSAAKRVLREGTDEERDHGRAEAALIARYGAELQP